MFMLSGHSSGAKLESELQAAYAAQGHPEPNLYYQPVLGASPWLAKAAATHLRPQLSANTGVLVVAHGSTLTEPPPEPALFCRRLRELLPGTEVALGYFSQQPEAADVLSRMQAKHVLLLPFLLTEGIHTTRDLPTTATAAACGKTLSRQPVVAALLHNNHSELS
jgi:sirohydrochlorin ferrochelatase